VSHSVRLPYDLQPRQHGPDPWQVQVDLLKDGPLTPATRPRVRVVLRYMSDECRHFKLVVVTKLRSRHLSGRASTASRATVHWAGTLDIGDSIALDITLPRPDWSNGLPALLSVDVYCDRVNRSTLLVSRPAEFRLPPGTSRFVVRLGVVDVSSGCLTINYFCYCAYTHGAGARVHPELFDVRPPQRISTQLLAQLWTTPVTTTMVVGPAGGGKSSFVNTLLSLSAATHEEWCPVYRAHRTLDGGDGMLPRTTRQANRVPLCPSHILLDTYAPPDDARIHAALAALLLSAAPVVVGHRLFFKAPAVVIVVVPAPAALQFVVTAEPTTKRGAEANDDGSH